ncbi:MAG: hypothetical protein ACYST2_02990 [Planctomycetota bacterium]
MSSITTIDSASLIPLLDKIKEQAHGCQTLEQAAQIVTDILYDQLSDSIVLVRVYATVPFAKLPDTNQNFVNNLAASNNITQLIKDDTLVLSLLATRGLKPPWNDRLKSQGHVGIPLASADFIDQVPMISRLLKEIVLDLDWIDSQDTNIVTESIAGISGVFYVEDAEQTVDNLGRKIIPAQDFVKENGVKTVFGLAIGYPDTSTFITMIVFCRDTLKKYQTEIFFPLIYTLKESTASLVSTQMIFV